MGWAQPFVAGQRRDVGRCLDVGPALTGFSACHLDAGHAGAHQNAEGASWSWTEGPPEHDPVNHPSHYTDRVPGIECIEVTEHFGFLRGNAIKYLWRAGLKGDELEDLRKARFYVDREIANLEAARSSPA